MRHYALVLDICSQNFNKASANRRCLAPVGLILGLHIPASNHDIRRLNTATHFTCRTQMDLRRKAQSAHVHVWLHRTCKPKDAQACIRLNFDLPSPHCLQKTLSKVGSIAMLRRPEISLCEEPQIRFSARSEFSEVGYDPSSLAICTGFEHSDTNSCLHSTCLLGYKGHPSIIGKD